MTNGEISFLVDTMLVETVLAEPKQYKTASFVSDLLSKVKDYFGSKVDPQNPTASVLNMLAPGVLWVTMSALGMGKWGMLIGVLMNVFHVDVSGIMSSLYNKVKALVGGGKKVSSEQIDAATESTIQEHSEPDVAAPARADDGKVYSSLELMPEAKLIRLAMISYEDHSLRLTKDAAPLFGRTATKARGVNILGRILGWVFKVALFSAGLMVAGDLINKIFGRPNSLDGTYQAGKEVPSSQSTAPSSTRSTQTKYQSSSDAPLPQSLSMVNNPTNIDNMIIQFAKDVYPGLSGKENLIRSSAGFQAVKEQIVYYNEDHLGSSVTFIPPLFSSKKKMVDYFIDDVAQSDR